MREPTRQRSGQTLDVEPIGSAGLDLQTNPALLGVDKLRTGRNISIVADAVERRKASVKTSVFADAMPYSKTLGTSDAKYAWFLPPLIPKGGFAIKGAFTANWPFLDNTAAFVVSSWTSAAMTHGVVWMSISDSGHLQANVEWQSGFVTTINVATALTDGRTYSFLLVYDPAAGTLTIYLACMEIREDIVGQATGLSNDLQPRQDAGVKWYLGVMFKPGTGPVANFSLGAAMGPFIGFAFRGADLTAGADDDPNLDTSLLHELRAGTFQDWPNPASRMILFHYPMREQTTGDLVPMYDASKFKNDGAYVGTPSSAAALVWPAANGNVVMTVRKASIGATSDASVNIVAAAGAAYYSQIQEGV